MNRPLYLITGAVCLLLPVALEAGWIGAAKQRLAEDSAAANEEVAVAAAADESYCSADLRKILRRVLQSCGLLATGEVRGCAPLEAKQVATMSGPDFNALFLPLSERAGILQFDSAQAELDPSDQTLLDELFADQRGASYFLVVARASPDGSREYNRELSQERGEAVLNHLRETFDDPDLDKEVGLLMLGEEFAQLDSQFCAWRRSGGEEECTSKDLNRSAFVAWIDCKI
jgi:outer membrane protein OmpA-like peptidoglycan-associated protein